ncbi:MAG: hypothetical protein II453_10225 [Alphaproteobacteria bacterium]|nr:hypothetical protein [Alphaproteobacteria bacterium]
MLTRALKDKRSHTPVKWCELEGVAIMCGDIVSSMMGVMLDNNSYF